MRTWREQALASLVVALVLNAAAHAQRDQVTPVNGPPLTGTITKISPTAIEMDVRGSVRQLAVNEIDKISFADETPDMRTARSRAKAGQFEEALALLNRIPLDSVPQQNVKADLQFDLAYCMGRLALSGGGDKQGAAKALIDFLNTHPQSYHYFEACELIGDLAFAMSRYDAASEYYQKLAAAPWPEYQMRAKVREARALVAQGKPQEALSRYEEVVNTPLDNAAANRQKLIAQTGRAACLAESGKPAEGQQLAEQVIRDNDPKDNAVLFAKAYNALGLCHLKADRPKDALLAFLHVDLLFNTDADSHAEALYYLSDLWTKVGKSDRAVEARSLLKSRYAGTTWAAK